MSDFIRGLHGLGNEICLKSESEEMKFVCQILSPKRDHGLEHSGERIHIQFKDISDL